MSWYLLMLMIIINMYIIYITAKKVGHMLTLHDHELYLLLVTCMRVNTMLTLSH